MLVRSLRSISIGLAGSVIAGVVLVGFWIVRASIALRTAQRQDPEVGHVVGVFGMHAWWWLGFFMLVGFTVAFTWSWRKW